MSKEQNIPYFKREVSSVISGIIAIAGALIFAYETSIWLAEPISRTFAVAALQQFSEEDQKYNHKYISISEKINLAIAAAEEKGITVYNDSKPISYTNPDVLNTIYLITRHEAGDIWRNHTIDPDYLKYMAVAVGQDHLPQELSITLTRYSANFQVYGDLTEIAGSGFARRQTPAQDIASAKEFILQEYAANSNQPLPSWRLLEYWLLENNGNYRESIHDAAITLEFLARNNAEGEFVGSFPEQSQENVEFYSKYIVDQSSLLRTYSSTYAAGGVYNSDPSMSALDQIGSEYHNFILAALDVELPAPYAVTLAEAQAFSQNQQSAVKSAGNMVTAMDLYKLQQITSLLPHKP